MGAEKDPSADTLDPGFSSQKDFHLVHQPVGAPGPLATSTASWPEPTDQAGSQMGPVYCPGGWPGWQTAMVCGLEGTDAARPPWCPSGLTQRSPAADLGRGWAGRVPRGAWLPIPGAPTLAPLRCGPAPSSLPSASPSPASPAPPRASAPAVLGPQHPPAPIFRARNPTRQSCSQPTPFSSCLPGASA